MRRPWSRDVGLSARMLLTMILLGIIYVAFIGLILLYVRNIAIIGVFVALFLGAQYYFSDRIVLAASGAHIVSEDEAPELHSLIERLCAMADLPKPKVAIAESSVPNAFATGRNQKHAVVAVTSSLLQRLDEPEIEAVLAHELSHVKNRDMLVMTIASFVTTIAGFLMRYWFFI
ncbi:MAG: M48 family metalloprotease, partial [Halobacteriota archaeon]